ncbi:MAG: protein-disulfide reductase DsbD N-terminal domain-containing protein [Mucilaginibacter sp.]|uniref:protein-disulfide reductase DsbD N-terminal domain-containing protein n=1 Tax=Mucilaginibacter sp. TaxID=1882438 RepID=UPI0032662082
MKKKFLIITIIGLMSLSLKAQILTPVKWSYGFKSISKVEVVVFLKATIDQGWHVYSQTVKDGGPVKTSFTFTPSAAYTLVGKTIEPQPIIKFEKVFGMDVRYFEREVVFQQKIKLKTGRVTVKGQLEYMTCNDRKCLPPDDVEFHIDVK